MRIEVTQEDIDRGEPLNCRSCPVALAINRHLPRSYWADVGEFACFIIRGSDIDRQRKPFMELFSEEHLLFRTPPEVADFINDLDEGTHFGTKLKPFSFRLSAEVFMVN
jgi:hypothetical protein